MKRGTSQHHMDGLIALLLFGVFAACVLAVLLTGAGAYRRLVGRDRAAYERRTCVQYIATRCVRRIRTAAYGCLISGAFRHWCWTRETDIRPRYTAATAG